MIGQLFSTPFDMMIKKRVKNNDNFLLRLKETNKKENSFISINKFINYLYF